MNLQAIWALIRTTYKNNLMKWTAILSCSCAISSQPHGIGHIQLVNLSKMSCNTAALSVLDSSSFQCLNVTCGNFTCGEDSILCKVRHVYW